MKYYILAFLLIPFFSFGQKHPFHFDRVSFSQLDSLESLFGGERRTFSYLVTVSPDYLPGLNTASLANPIAYTRKKPTEAPAVQYFYSLPDSIFQFVEYSWDFKGGSSADLDKLFQKNKKIISKQLSSDKSMKPREYDSGKEGWRGLTCIWESDRLFIKQLLIDGSNTHRVRVIIWWKS